MFSKFTTRFTEDETKQFELLLTQELPSSLGRYASQGGKFLPFTVETDDGRNFQVTLLPEQMSHVVNRDEAEKQDAFAIIVNRDEQTSWYVPSETVDESSILPELRQAFYESVDYTERSADYRYHFSNGSTQVASPSANPIQRLDETIVFTAVQSLGTGIKQRFLLQAKNDSYYYLQERSGSIRLIENAGNGDEVFHAFIGREHPGTPLKENEVLNIISAVEYITITDDYETTVPEEAHNLYWNK